MQRPLAMALAAALAACQGDPVGEANGDAGASDAGDGGPNPWTLVYEDPKAALEDALHDVHAFSNDDLWVVGKNQQILHFTGGKWDPFSQIPGAHLYGIWGEQSTALTAVGASAFDLSPLVLNYDGNGWISGAPFPAGLPALTDVWGTGTQRYFTALAGKIFQDDPVVHPTDRYHLAVITGGCPTGNEPSPTLNAIDGESLDNILAAGDSGVLAHKDSKGWTRLCAPDLKISYASVFHLPGSQTFFVGSNFLGLLWFLDRNKPLAQVYQNLAISDANQAYIQRISGDASRIVAVGDRGTVLYFDLKSDPRTLPSPTGDTLYGVALSGDTLWVSGRKNRVWRAQLSELAAQ